MIRFHLSPRVQSAIDSVRRGLTLAWHRAVADTVRTRDAVKEWLAPHPEVRQTPVTPPPTPAPSQLFTPEPHPHVARNANELHKAEQAAAGFNSRLAVHLTQLVGSMWCAYIFTVLSVVGLLGLLGLLNPFTFLLATWVSQQFLQLVFLPILSVGQGVLGRHAEIQADEMFAITQRDDHNLLQIMEHLSAQDSEQLALEQRIAAMEDINRQQLALLMTQGAQIAALVQTPRAKSTTTTMTTDTPAAP